MEGCGDFIERVGKVLSIKVLLCLEDPADLVRVSAVSRSWHQFGSNFVRLGRLNTTCGNCAVIKNGLCKRFCLRMCPELANVDIVEISTSSETAGFKSPILKVMKIEDRDHRVNANLASSLTSFGTETCMISAAISASSTDDYPEEGIQNTLEPRDEVGRRPSYWSSKGESDPAVPKTLIYKLVSNLCVISEIHLRPFKAYFQHGRPIYSSKAVRFSVGYLKSPLGIERLTEFASGQGFSDDMFVWTYI